MTRRTRLPSLAAVLASAALLLPLVTPAPAGAQRAAARLKPDSVSITVDDLQPNVLPTDAKPHPLLVTLTVTNHSDRELSGLTIEGERGEPIDSQAQLDHAIKHLSAPAGHVVPVEPTTPLTLDLAPSARQQVVFRSTTSTTSASGNRGLCNCTNAGQPALVYPLYFTAHVKGSGGVDQTFGLASTFVSAFASAPAPVRVNWAWPLIDQPHLLDDNAAGNTGPVFSDDFLAASVGPGGRLDRALAVVERVAQDPAKPPMTLVVDPELLQELQIMSTGNYEVRRGTKAPVKGTGKDVAAAWLLRLKNVLAAAPQLSLQFTPYADPDVESLTAHGLHWSATLPAAMAHRVETAIGRPIPTTTVAWPAAQALSDETLTALVGHGISTVLLDSSAVRPKPTSEAVRPGLARLSVGGEDVAVGLLDPGLQRYAEEAVTSGRQGAAALPLLMSELAVRAVVEPGAAHVAVVAPPRWVDPDVDTAVRVIETTSASPVTRPILLADAVGGELLPNGRSRLAPVAAADRTLPADALDTVQRVASDRATLKAVLTPVPPDTLDPQAAALLAELPLEGQRVAAAAWGRSGNAASAAAFAEQLTTQLASLTAGVTIVQSRNPGTYTLASSNSPLPITVRNDLPFPVRVQVVVRSQNGLPGFTAQPKTEVVEAHQKATLKLRTNIDRSGRIRVTAALYTPDGRRRLSDPVDLTVRSTALGVVGVVITIVAGAVLVLALVIRFGRRLRRRLRRDDPERPRFDPDAPGAAQVFAERVGADGAPRETAEPAP